MNNQDWTFFTNHGHVLFAIARQPELRMREVAEMVGITERAVQRIVQDLSEAGYIEREKSGRRNRYSICEKLPLRHSVERHCEVGELLSVVLRRSS